VSAGAGLLRALTGSATVGALTGSATVGAVAGSATVGATTAWAKPRRAYVEKPHAEGAGKAGDDEEGGAFSAASGPPAQTPLGPMETVAQWAFIVDFNTGATLLDKQADAQMPPSSMTKLMTAYIVYSKLKAGTLRLDQTLPVSEHAWRTQGSKMFVELNGQIKVEDLIRGMIIQSGNDACIVLAEGIAGTEEQFVELMNAEAKKLGLSNSYFRNCTGWPDPQHHMSARDIATLAHAIIKDFPEYYKYDSEKTFTYHGIVQYNRNPLVQRGLADGLKTGHTEAGGFGVVGSADHGGRRVIMVLNGMPSSHARVEESIRLMSWAFSNFENVTLFSANDVVEYAPVYLGARPHVPLVGGQDLVMTMPRSWRQHARVSIDYDSPIPAPVRAGDVVGRLVVSGQGVPQVERPLLAGEDVGRLGVGGRAVKVLAHYVTGA
jgi:D-alanyl-D-alanine carboxypeptidase (penicillin-binding protein 5/6)